MGPALLLRPAVGQGLQTIVDAHPRHALFLEHNAAAPPMVVETRFSAARARQVRPVLPTRAFAPADGNSAIISAFPIALAARTTIAVDLPCVLSLVRAVLVARVQLVRLCIAPITPMETIFCLSIRTKGHPSVRFTKAKYFMFMRRLVSGGCRFSDV